MSEQYFFRVNGMQGAGCEETIETAVTHVKGVDYVEADYESGMVIVKGSAKVSAITNAINAEGYNAILVGE